MSASIAGDWARLLFGSLAEAGLRDVVVSPGSRSTPFVWAAARTSGLTCHSVVDERSAAFWALGHARVSGAPVALLCTSGSAASNYLPAVVEASLAKLPLLVITADRPLELQQTAAPQTIDQVKLYGDFARRFFDLGAPDGSPAALAALKRVATQALFATRQPAPGPVHLNARARKPLEPAAAESELERATSSEVDRLLSSGVASSPAARSEPAPEALDWLAERLAKSERTLFVAGPLAAGERDAASALGELTRDHELPLFAEATSQARFGATVPEVDALDWILRSPCGRAACRPELVVRFGAPPCSAGLERVLAETPAPALVVAGGEPFGDPTNGAEAFVTGSPLRVVQGLAERLARRPNSPKSSSYRARLASANRAAWQAVESSLSSALDEPGAVRAAVAALPEGGCLMLGNSLPVREVDSYVRAGSRRLRVLSQRGASGIDGLVSGAAGAASAAKAPLLLLLGDVSLGHDLGGLALVARATTPLVVLVLDNGGGRIFEQLPLARLFAEEPDHAHLWLTPPSLSFEHAAATFGIRFAAPETQSALAAALASALAEPGATLVHARVPAHGARDTMAAASERVDRALAELFGVGGAA